jgi:hypothetical protein
MAPRAPAPWNLAYTSITMRQVQHGAMHEVQNALMM